MENKEGREEEFKIEVLTKLAVIESKVDGFTEAKKVTYEADTRSRSNEKRISDLEEKQKWLSRSALGAVITAIVGIVFIYLKIGLGVN